MTSGALPDQSSSPRVGISQDLVPTVGVRRFTLVSMWLGVGATLLFSIAAFVRKTTWEGYLTTTNTLDDVDNADGFVGVAAFLVLSLTFTTAVLLAVWSNRAATNAKVCGASVSPGFLSGSWFIPIGWLWIPFSRLRALGRVDVRSLRIWQASFAIYFALTLVVANVLGDFDPTDPGPITDRMRAQGIVTLIGAAAAGVAAVCAARAMRSVEDAALTR